MLSMAKLPNNGNATPNRAQAAFTASEQRDALVRDMIDKERAATDAKTAKLRAMRMAKEEEERVAAANAPAAEAKPKKKKIRTIKVG